MTDQAISFDRLPPMYFPDEGSMKSFFTAFTEMQAVLKNPQPDTKNPFYKSSFASLESILTMLRPVLNAHGFFLSQGFLTEDGEQVLSTSLIHKDGGAMTSKTLIPKSEASAQQVVSYSTYMRRIHLCSMVGIREEGEGETASGGGSQPWAEAAPAPVPTPPAPAPVPPVGPSQPPPSVPVPAPSQNGTMPWAAAPAPAATPQPVQAATAQSAPPPPPAPVPVQQAAPVDPIVGDMLIQARNVVSAIKRTWGEEELANIMERSGIDNIETAGVHRYGAFLVGLQEYAQMNSKKLNLYGPEAGNAVSIE